ncbi:carbamoyltransferase HypF [Flavihumibacter profundi]|jgi:hydrogenase maturation protein HypF|uniref:carbamoyltransferase HypF n=1 Tax=Flavihumibacter profundi TaxID=2716883 RepID=UPI001CC49424|nr:carbamoyltransferase HypF [Flavihumibacter profundi]MBZ5859342.1 carbamoyltransferase HypF [Flavihumibacter profundi]
MYQTFHIHINGLVQGVGFRPAVYQLAQKMHIKGWVCNANDGLNIVISAGKEQAHDFYRQLILHPPPNACITSHKISLTKTEYFTDFSIRKSNEDNLPGTLLTPDIAICPDCLRDIHDQKNRRYGYAFTTCLQCGPRYSITQALPYDRENTTMHSLPMCPVCTAEYNDPIQRRHYSQTNSCPECAIHMCLYSSREIAIPVPENELIRLTASHIRDGKIIAVKGTGGYLFICDATNNATILNLRKRKHRPAKPFALMYPTIEMAREDVVISIHEQDALQSKAAPIILCRLVEGIECRLPAASIAPGLDKLGVLLPHTPLLQLLADHTRFPLIATSANISGSPIVYKDEEALDHLFDVADYVLTYNREIVVPQDDSVVQFNDSGQKILLRRSRGLAPDYLPNPFNNIGENILATGSELKSAFAFLHKNNLYISQFLGNLGTLESQDAYDKTLHHLLRLLQATPQKILTDTHPGYMAAQMGRELADRLAIGPAIEIQHHKAHFGAVLAENNLLDTKQPVLGFTWDGTGYGDDHQVWGSEIFLYQHYHMERLAHLAYFPQLLGDKMSREPRLSSLSLLHGFPGKQHLIQHHFTPGEWAYYQKKLVTDTSLFTSSMGRFLDGLACLLGICSFNSYEGEAAMKLEAMARKFTGTSKKIYGLPLANRKLDWHEFIKPFIKDIENKKPITEIAYTVFLSLAASIKKISDDLRIDQLAFSGGIFQNTLLTDMIIREMGNQKTLFFHRQLSPNDESIGFGQLACYYISKQKTSPEIKSYVLSHTG